MAATMLYVVYATAADAVAPHRWIVKQDFIYSAPRTSYTSPYKSFASYTEADNYRREQNARWGKKCGWRPSRGDYIPAGARDSGV